MEDSHRAPEVYAALATIAAAARSAYADGSNLRVRSSGIVHEVATPKGEPQWFADERMPGPACMVGVSGWDPGAAHPDRGPVKCRRCLKLTGAEPLGEQLELFGDSERSASGDDAADGTA